MAFLGKQETETSTHATFKAAEYTGLEILLDSTVLSMP